MTQQGFEQTLITAQVDGTALTNSVAATSILPLQAVFPLQPQTLMYPGQKLRLTMWGRISTLTAAPGTLTLDVRFGGAIVFNGGAMALNVNAKVNVTWMLEIELTCRAPMGALATVIGTGMFTSEAVIGSPAAAAGGSGSLLLPASAPAAGATFDSTAQQAVNVFGTWSVANAANSILVHQYSLELVN